MNPVNWVKRLLRGSPRVHAWQNPAATPLALVEVMDRFVDGRAAYPLEWDDFISWEQANPNVEQIRQRLGAYEKMLFSQTMAGQAAYVDEVLRERNALAAVLGLAPKMNAQVNSPLPRG